MRAWAAAVVTGLALVLGLTFFVAVAGDPADEDATPAACDERGRGVAKELEKEHPGQGKARGLEKEHPGQGKARGLEKEHPGQGKAKGRDKADHPSRNGLDRAPGRAGCN